jgi:predicted amidohydrolase YtcJ
MSFADLVFKNGPVVTMDAKRRVADAVAVKDGRILAVGSEPEVKRLIGPTTEVIDLEGQALTPGLVNTHDHMLEQGISSAFVTDIRYPKAKSIKDIQGIMEDRVREASPGQWVLGHAWDETLLDDRRFPNRHDLDPFSPENPVYIKRVFQMGVANTKALGIAGITRDTLDPEFGTIERDEDGEPTGLLRGRAAKLVTDAIEWTLEDKEEAIRQACTDYHSVGFTTLIEPGLLEDEIEAYRSSHAKKELTIRTLIQVGFLRSLDEANWAVDNYAVGGDDMLRVVGLKMMVDGGVGPRTALFYEGYRDRPDVHGVQMIDQDELNEMVHLGHVNGFQVAIHAIGDKAIDIAVAAYEYAQVKTFRLEPRHQLVHCYFPSEEALGKIEKLGVMVNTQTPFIYFLGDSFLEALGAERCEECMPVKTITERGIPVGISHDATVTQPLPNVGLYATVARKTIKGASLGIVEAVTAEEALSFYTDKAALHAFMEDRVGSIEVGKYADLAVWNFNPLEVEPERLLDWECQMTFVGGRRVFSRE